MQISRRPQLALLALLLDLAPCSGYSCLPQPPAPFIHHATPATAATATLTTTSNDALLRRPHAASLITHRAAVPTASASSSSSSSTAAVPTASASSSSSSSNRTPPAAIVFKANAATKYAVVLAQTAAVLLRRDFAAPFIVVGSIGSAFAAHALKKLINEQRPEGSPFSDPGMPSSHALVATFAATAWAVQLGVRPLPTTLLACSALTVSSLRVITGYHTLAQIAVGTLLGLGGAVGWMRLGSAITRGVAMPVATKAIYATYLVGSFYFVKDKISKWSTQK